MIHREIPLILIHFKIREFKNIWHQYCWNNLISIDVMAFFNVKFETPLSTMKQNLEEMNVFWGKNSEFNGKIISEGIFRLDGKMEGEIFHSGTLIIGETAVIKGKMEVNVLTLNGTIEGEVKAKERVEIHSKGKLFGTLFTPILVVQDGGIFEGNCKMVATSNHGVELQDPGKAVT